MTRTLRQHLRLGFLRAFARATQSSGADSVSLDKAALETPPAPRILVVRPDHLGDLLFITPALDVLRQRYPDAHITALVGPWGTPVLTNNPHVDDTVSLPFPGFSKQPKPTFWQPYALLRQWAQRSRGQYDLAIILRYDHWWGALLTYMARVPQRIGYAMPEVAPFLSHTLPYAVGRHEVEQNIRLVSCGAPDEHQAEGPSHTIAPQHYSLEFHVPENAVAWAQDALGNARSIVIHPGAGAAIKLWRAEGWAAVADALARETGHEIMLTGSPGEINLCQAIAKRMETKALVLAGRTTLDQLAAILSKCRLVLGLDSGPLHLAVALGTPTVHLYGPVDHLAFGPWGAVDRHRVLTSDWPCIACNRLDYGPDESVHHPCVRGIDVNQVLTAAHQVLAR